MPGLVDLRARPGHGVAAAVALPPVPPEMLAVVELAETPAVSGVVASPVLAEIASVHIPSLCEDTKSAPISAASDTTLPACQWSVDGDGSYVDVGYLLQCPDLQ
jgi:hypothetical protein